MENSVDTYITGAVPVNTDGFVNDTNGDTFIMNSEPLDVETTTTDVPTDAPTDTTTDTDTDSGITLNKPIHKFMSNANPFFIGIGVVVGLILLGDFFKSKPPQV
jgi:hypothetical protein